MGFYFICYVIVGACFGIAGTVHLSRQDERRVFLGEIWLNPPTWAELIILAGAVAPVLGLLTSLIQGGVWVFATLIELAVGAIAARLMIPLKSMNLLLLLIPIPLVIIFGALWGFWFI